jgi:hypothetical protein
MSSSKKKKKKKRAEHSVSPNTGLQPQEAIRPRRSPLLELRHNRHSSGLSDVCSTIPPLTLFLSEPSVLSVSPLFLSLGLLSSSCPLLLVVSTSRLLFLAYCCSSFCFLPSPLLPYFVTESQSHSTGISLGVRAVASNVTLVVALVARAGAAGSTTAAAAASLLTGCRALAAHVALLAAVEACSRRSAAAAAERATTGTESAATAARCTTATSLLAGCGALAADVAGLTAVVAAARGNLCLSAVLGHVAGLVALVAGDWAGHFCCCKLKEKRS